MRWVVDTNMLASPELGEYLARSGSFRAVICDIVAIESYQARDIKELRQHYSMLRTAPAKVILLKDGNSCLRMAGREAGLARRLVDQPTTREFPLFCRNLFGNDRGAERLLTERREAAVEHLKAVEEFASKMPEIVQDMTEYFTEQEIRIFRRGERMTPAMIDKIMVFCRKTVDDILKKYGMRPPRNMNEWINSFGVRAMLAMFINILIWLRKGRSTDNSEHNARRTRNDFMDAMIAAYASYFDGLLSDDRGTMRTYAELGVIVESFKSVARGRR